MAQIRHVRFTQADVKRALTAARKAKVEIAAVRIEPNGAITLIPGTPEIVAPSPQPQPNSWDAKWEDKP